jgi:oligopeptide transport system substrate-binding protein
MKTGTLVSSSFVGGLLVCAISVIGLGTIYIDAQAMQKQSLNIADEGLADLPTLDPQLAGDSNSAVVTNRLFVGLVRNDLNGKAVPDLASWKVSSDGKVYTFNLLPKARFSDGSPVTAQDVIWSLSRTASPALKAKGASGINNLGLIVGAQAYNDGKAKSIAGLKATGSRTIQIRLSQAAAYFPAQLTLDAANILEKSAYLSRKTLIGAGPFKLLEWKHGQSVSLLPNPYYVLGKPKLDGITVKFYANPETAYNAYLTGAVDITGAVHFPSARLTEATTRPDFHSSARLGVTYLVPNHTQAPFDNPKLRLAFSAAIDRDALAKVLGGQVNPSDRALPPGIACYNKKLRNQTFNPDAAKKALADAGFPEGQGLPSITYTYGANGADQDRIAAALQQMWQDTLGVQVKLNAMEMGSYFKALDARNFQIAMIEWGADFPDPQNFLSLQLQTGSSNNNAMYSNAEFDKLTKQADVSSGTGRCGLYEQAEKLALDEAAWFPLYNPKTTVLIRPSVKGLEIGPLGLNAQDWSKVTNVK